MASSRGEIPTPSSTVAPVISDLLGLCSLASSMAEPRMRTSGRMARKIHPTCLLKPWRPATQMAKTRAGL